MIFNSSGDCNKCSHDKSNHTVLEEDELVQWHCNQCTCIQNEVDQPTCLLCTHEIIWHYQEPGLVGSRVTADLWPCSECGCSIFSPDRNTRILVGHYHLEPDDEYLKILEEMREMHRKKAADYGGNTGTDNLRASAEFGIAPWLGAVLRMNDKVTRIKSLTKNGRLENESLEDSLMDIAAYAILSLVLYREGQHD